LVTTAFILGLAHSMYSKALSAAEIPKLESLYKRNFNQKEALDLFNANVVKSNKEPSKNSLKLMEEVSLVLSARKNRFNTGLHEVEEDLNLGLKQFQKDMKAIRISSAEKTKPTKVQLAEV